MHVCWFTSSPPSGSSGPSHAASARVLGNVVTQARSSGQTVRPGTGDVAVFVVQIKNNATLGVAQLTAISFQNKTAGPGTIAQRDRDWTALVVARVAGGAVVDTASFVGGVVTFDNFNVAVHAQGTATLVISGGASLVARDSDALDLRSRARRT